MSVIAWDGKSFAADRQGSNGELRFVAPKLTREAYGKPDREEFAILGMTGNQANGLLLKRWWLDGANPNAWPASQRSEDDWSRLIVWTRSLGVATFEKEPVAMLVEDPFMAWGSGRDFAMGAMARGATAREAVEIACRFSIYCGLGIDEFSIEDLAR